VPVAADKTFEQLSLGDIGFARHRRQPVDMPQYACERDTGHESLLAAAGFPLL
jgi:hypothetical protein